MPLGCEQLGGIHFLWGLKNNPDAVRDDGVSTLIQHHVFVGRFVLASLSANAGFVGYSYRHSAWGFVKKLLDDIFNFT